MKNGHDRSIQRSIQGCTNQHLRRITSAVPMPDTLPPAHAGLRAGYGYFLAIPTRWMDNDTYGHVNNVTYYSYFDTAVNEHLIRAGGLDIRASPVIGLVVETRCRFH